MDAIRSLGFCMFVSFFFCSFFCTTTTSFSSIFKPTATRLCLISVSPAPNHHRACSRRPAGDSHIHSHSLRARQPLLLPFPYPGIHIQPLLPMPVLGYFLC